MKGISVLITAFMLIAAAAAAEGPRYFIAVENGAYNFRGGEKQLGESYKALEAMVKLAGEQNARLTLLFSAQYALYISTDPARLAALEAWKDSGHEIGAYHQGPDTRAWDGYSDLPAQKLSLLRKERTSAGAVPGHGDYLAALARLEPAVKTGCMVDREDKEFRAVFPPYEICGFSGGKGKEGAGAAGVNEFISISGEGKSRKFLSSFRPADKAGVEAAEKVFSGMSSGVYGTVFRSSPSEFGAFYVWLAFLRGSDPAGERSRTVNTAVNGGLLKEKKIARAVPVRKEKKQAALPMPVPSQNVAETQKKAIPKLKPVRSFFGSVHRVIFGPRFVGPKPRSGYCGDGICDAMERAHAGRCPRDCGR
jgi:hypothetical protein